MNSTANRIPAKHLDKVAQVLRGYLPPTPQVPQCTHGKLNICTRFCLQVASSML